MKHFLWISAAGLGIFVAAYFFMHQGVVPVSSGSSANVAHKPNIGGGGEKTSALIAIDGSAKSQVRATATAQVSRTKTISDRFRTGDRLSQAYAEIIADSKNSASSQYLAAKIVSQCALTAGNESSFVPLNEGTRAMAFASLRKLNESCAGLDLSKAALSRTAEYKKAALAKGDPYALAEATMQLAAQDLKADAFEIGRGLLKKSPDDPDVWQTLIEMLPAMGIQIGAKDEQLRHFMPDQITAAMMLVACEATLSCSHEESIFLQTECVTGGRCSMSMLDYVREYVLPPGAMAQVPAAAARLNDLISQRRWDLIGYAPANKPTQVKPSVLPPQPKG